MDKTIAILAAGIGSRYGGLKQMDPVGPSGEFIIDYSVFDAKRAGFTKVVFIIRKDIEEAFRSTIGARVEKQIRCEYVFQELKALPAPFTVPAERTKPWGTVQAVLACKQAIAEPFAVINADDYYGQDSYAVLAKALGGMKADSTDYCMVGFMTRQTLSEHGSVTRGLCRSSAQGYLEGLEEVSGIEKDGNGARYKAADGSVKSLTGDELVSMNMWGFGPRIFADFEAQFVQFLTTSIAVPKSELVIPTAVGDLVARRKATVRVLSTTSPWFGITHPADKPATVAQIKALVAAGKYPTQLWR